MSSWHHLSFASSSVGITVADEKYCRLLVFLVLSVFLDLSVFLSESDIIIDFTECKFINICIRYLAVSICISTGI